MDPRSILVPLDGSAVAESALSAVEGLSTRPGTRLLLVRAFDEPRPLAIHEAEKYLDATARMLTARGFDDIETVVRYGTAARVILDTARTHEATLIVMATRGRSGLARLMSGSVTEAVIRGAPTPVLVVRGDVQYGLHGRRHAVSRENEPAGA